VSGSAPTSTVSNTSSRWARAPSSSPGRARYHNYLLEGTTSNSAFTLLVDGQVVGSGIGAPADPSVDNLFFGDGSSRANAIGDYTALVYTAGVPELTTWAMMVIGFCLIGQRLGWRYGPRGFGTGAGAQDGNRRPLSLHHRGPLSVRDCGALSVCGCGAFSVRGWGLPGGCCAS